MRRSVKTACLALLMGVAAQGCAPEFDPPTELESLRILGVQKDKPYAAPGETVTLRMLWHDGSGEQREVQRAWVSGCVNPPGDLYQGCFASLAQATSDPANFGLGDEHSFTVPDTILDGRKGEAGQPPYGISYVFFAVCAGTLGVDPQQGAFPVTCLDAQGEPLGPDDFVIGYSAIYTFADFGNRNPVVTGFQFRGARVTEDCIGEACVGMPLGEGPDCSAPDAPCVPACAEDGEPECETYDAMVLVDQAQSVEVDEVSKIAYDTDFNEQLWVNYYVDGGSVSSGVKLVNDATKGWNAEQETEFRAPKEPGPVALWALVHDNRGGVEFARFTIGVQ